MEKVKILKQGENFGKTATVQFTFGNMVRVNSEKHLKGDGQSDYHTWYSQEQVEFIKI